MNKLENIWIYAEKDSDGGILAASLQLLKPASQLASDSSAKLSALIINGTAADIKELSEYGAEEIINIDCPGLPAENYPEALAYAAEKYKPDAFITAASAEGRVLAPEISTLLNTGLTADCTGLSFCPEDGYIHFIRPALGGNIMAEIICRVGKPQMGTVRPNIFPLPEKRKGSARVISEKYETHFRSRIRLIETLKEAASERAQLDRAEIIVAGGKGLGRAEGFELLKKLASVLGAELGASRAAVDAGWISHSHQVGQTGTAVSPKLYIACGISGAVQHIAGIAAAEHIVAINSDPDAPILKYADLALLGDLYEIIPRIIKELEGHGSL